MKRNIEISRAYFSGVPKTVFEEVQGNLIDLVILSFAGLKSHRKCANFGLEAVMENSITLVFS